MYLLDTDVIIDHLKNKNPIPERIINSELFISIITKAELIFGAYRHPKTHKILKNIEAFLSTLKIKTINFEDKILHKYSEIKTHLTSKEKIITDFDIFIAATAIVYKLSLVSRNIKHYQRIPDLSIFPIKTSEDLICLI